MQYVISCIVKITNVETYLYFTNSLIPRADEFYIT